MKTHDQSEKTVKSNGLRAALFLLAGILILGAIAFAIYGTAPDVNPLMEPAADPALETPAPRAE